MAYPATAAPPRAYWFTPIAVISGYTSMPAARADRRQPRAHRTGSLASIGFTLPAGFARFAEQRTAGVAGVAGQRTAGVARVGEQRARRPAVGHDHDAE